MADDIKPDDIPFLMDQEIKLVDENGKQTTAFQDWFQDLWSWMKRSVVDLTTKVSEISISVGDAFAAITEEQAVRASADEALASQIVTVETQLGEAEASIVTETLARTTADEALAAQITSVESQVGDAEASIVDETLARTTADEALAATLSTVSTTVDGNTAAISTLTSSLDGLSVQYAVVGTIDGVTGGFVFQGVRQAGGGATYDLIISANVTINGNLLVNGSVTEDGLSLYSATRRSSSFWTSTYEAQGWYTHYFTATAGSTVLIMAATSGNSGALPVFRALGFTDEVDIPVNKSSLIVRGYVISVTGTHSVDIIARGTTFGATCDLFVNVIVIQR